MSIETGRISNRIKYKKSGKIAWIKLLLNVMFASSLDIVNYQLSNAMGERYIRIQSQLKIASAEMDNVTPKNIKCLQHRLRFVFAAGEHAQTGPAEVLTPCLGSLSVASLTLRWWAA